MFFLCNSNKNEKKRNGEIDLIRYFFALSIMACHFGIDYHKGFMSKGYIGVEFFFLVTGYLMAVSAKKIVKTNDIDFNSQIPKLTWIFVLKKIKSFYPYYFFALILKYISIYCIIDYKGKKELVTTLMQSIPVFSLTMYPFDINGLGLSINGCWYLSAMIIAVFILFPLLLWNYDIISKLVFPILGSFIIGYISVKYKKCLGTHNAFDGIVYSGILRAIGEIALGVSLKSLVDWLNIFNFSKSHKIILSFLKYIALLTVVVYTTNIFNMTIDVHILIICAIFVTLSFSEATYSIKENAVTDFFGKESLILYIFAGLCRNIMNKVIIKGSNISIKRIIMYMVLIICGSFIFQFITDIIMKYLKKYVKLPKNIK